MAQPQILDVLAQRRSRVAFDPTHTIGENELTALLEAARWAPSSNNAQPWRWVIARRNETAFEKIHALLMPGNQAWAKHASVLMMVLAEVKRTNHEGRLVNNRTAYYDVGMAAMSLVVEATQRGLNARMMGGFNYDVARTLFAAELDPVCVMALGKANDGSHLAPDVAERDKRPRVRKSIDESIVSI
jgi:nitroreductase